MRRYFPDLGILSLQRYSAENSPYNSQVTSPRHWLGEFLISTLFCFWRVQLELSQSTPPPTMHHPLIPYKLCSDYKLTPQLNSLLLRLGRYEQYSEVGLDKVRLPERPIVFVARRKTATSSKSQRARPPSPPLHIKHYIIRNNEEFA